MNEIAIPYHLIIPAAITLCGIILIVRSRKKLFANDKLLWSSILFFCLIYFLIVGSAAYFDLYYQIDLYKYDLNKDGFFNDAESTAQQQIAMQKLSRDVGRNFSIIIGFFFAVVLASFVYMIGFIFNKLTKNKKPI